MPVTKQWPSGTVNATPTSYQLPLNNELNWLQLSSFLQSLADSAQGTTFQKMRVRTVTATPDTVNATVDCILPINVASASAINLPAGLEKQVFFIFDASGAAATNNITITPNGAETVRGAASLVLNKNYQGVILAFTGTDWKAFGPFITPGSVTDADFSGVLTTAKGGTGQNSTATFPGSGVVATVPAAGVVKSNGTVLSSSNVNLASEVTGVLPTVNGGTGQNSTATFPASGAVAVVPAAGVVKSNGTVLSSSNVNLTSEVTGVLPNANTTATSANTASAIVARDGSGNFSAGTITASLSGNATTATSATTAGNVTGTVAIANGGSGQTTANAALNAFLPNQATNAGKVLQTDGSNTSWASVLANGSTLLAADGTEGAPGIAFNSDTDTGFYRIGANNLGFSANGLKIGEFGTSGWTFGRVSTANTHTFNTNTSTQTIKLTGNTNYPGIILDNFANSAAASIFPASGTTIISFCQPAFAINANTYGNVTDSTNMGGTGGTNIASATSAGSWTFGPSSGSATFTIQGSGASTLLSVATTGGNNAVLDIVSGGGSNSAILKMTSGASGYGNFQLGTASTTFRWQNSSSTSLAEITSNGVCQFGPTSAATNNYHRFYANENSQYVLQCIQNSSGVNPYGMRVFYPNAAPNDNNGFFFEGRDSSAQRFAVINNGGVANYQANDVNLSDERLKKNIKLTSSKLDFICSLQVKDFEYIDNPGVINTGLIAQDVELLDQSLVQELKDFQIINGEKIRPKAIRTTEIYHMLIKAIQELKGLIDAIQV
jgi:hypothetical protein